MTPLEILRNIVDTKVSGRGHKAELVDDLITVSGPCMFNGKPYSVTAPALQFHDWLINGAFAQRAFYNMSAEDREFLISGASPEGFAECFGEDD